MGATLEALKKLQQAETQLIALKQRIAKKSRTAALMDRKTAEAKQEIDKLHALIRDRQKEADRIELEVKSRDSSILKLRTALNTCKTNKEYAAVLTQLNTDKADVSKMEVRVLEALTEIDQLKAKEAQKIQEYEAVKARSRQATEEMDQYRRATEQELSALSTQRDLAGKDVPPAAMQAFERISEKHDGEVLVPVIRADFKREEYSCGGCHMAITLQHINSLKTRDDLQVCPNCSRILYLDQDML